jgi:hypothetical protein
VLEVCLIKSNHGQHGQFELRGSRQTVVLGGCPMAAFKEGGGTVPRGYAKLRGDNEGDSLIQN